MALGVIDTLDLGAILFTDANIIHISGNVYAIAYQNGSVLTITINNAGGIGSVIDTLAFDAVGSQPRTIHISGNIYAIVYRGYTANYDIKIVTVDIDAVGNIGAVINSLTLASEYAYPDIVHVSGNVYAIVFQGSGRDGYLKTITIEDNGTIGSVIDTLAFDTGYGGQPYITHVSGVIYAIVYRGGTWIVEHDCRIVTVDIDNTGNIGAVIASLTIPPLKAGSTQIQLGGILHISGNIFAIFFSDYNALPRLAVFLKTFDVDATGNIGAVIDSSEVGFCGMIYGPEMTQLSGSLYALAYTNHVGNGTLKTITIDSDGTIGAVIDTVEFDTSVSGRRPGILSITTSMLAIAYNADVTHGFLTTVGPVVALPTVTTNPATEIS